MRRRQALRTLATTALGTAAGAPLAAARAEGLAAANPRGGNLPGLQPGEIAPRPLRHTWTGLGNVDQLRWVARADMQAQLELCRDELGLRHVRAVGLFDDDLYVQSLDPANFFLGEEKRGQLRLNWRTPLYIYDSLVSLGLKPVVTTCFTPTAMASGDTTVFRTENNVTPPRDWTAWAALINDFVRTLADRYGVAELRIWYFEAWNEPNLTSFWTGGPEGYWRLYQTLYDAVKAVDPELRVGGPSTARGEWIGDFLDYTTKADSPPDFIVAHCYNNDSADAPLSPFFGPQTDRENASPNFLTGVVRGVREVLRERDYAGELHFNEWGASWHPFAPVRETANEAAYIVKTMREVWDQADYFSYWALSDIYNQVGYGREAFHGNYGLLSMDGLRKPAYFAHVLLNRLGDELIESPDVADDPSRGCFSSRSSETGAVQLLFYAYDIDFAIGDQPTGSSTDVGLPEGADVRRARITRVDERNNNILTEWRALGSPAIPTVEQVTFLRKRNELRSQSLEPYVGEVNGKLVASLDLLVPGIALVEFPMLDD